MNIPLKSPFSAQSRRSTEPSPFQRFSFQHFSFTQSPLFPALRSGLKAVSGASRQKQIPSSDCEKNTAGIAKLENPARPIKMLYLKLVRQLHPDENRHHGPAESALWHDVQTACKSGNLARLEAVFARYEQSVADTVDSIPVGMIQIVILDIKGALREVNRRVKSLRAHSAWKFSFEKPAEQRRREPKYESGEIERHLEYVTSLLDRLAKTNAASQTPGAGTMSRAR
jgi:hypothetical protein